MAGDSFEQTSRSKVLETSHAGPGKILEDSCPGPLFLCCTLLILYKGEVRAQDHPRKCIKHKGFACLKKQDHLKSDWITLGSPVDPLWIPHGSPLPNTLTEPPFDVLWLHAHARFRFFQLTSAGTNCCPSVTKCPIQTVQGGG